MILLMAVAGSAFCLIGGYFFAAYRYWMWNTQRGREIADQVSEQVRAIKESRIVELTEQMRLHRKFRALLAEELGVPARSASMILEIRRLRGRESGLR
jgi:hypothetical protein